jgi:hypothetical protein
LRNNLRWTSKEGPVIAKVDHFQNVVKAYQTIFCTILFQDESRLGSYTVSTGK